MAVYIIFKLWQGATAVLVLHDGRQRNSQPIQIVSVTFLARKWRCIVWLLRMWNDVTGSGWRRQEGGKGVTVLEGIGARAWFWERWEKRKGGKKLAENCNVKMVTGEGPISGTKKKKVAQNPNLKMVTGEGPISGTWC